MKRYIWAVKCKYSLSILICKYNSQTCHIDLWKQNERVPYFNLFIFSRELFEHVCMLGNAHLTLRCMWGCYFWRMLCARERTFNLKVYVGCYVWRILCARERTFNLRCMWGCYIWRILCARQRTFNLNVYVGVLCLKNILCRQGLH